MSRRCHIAIVDPAGHTAELESFNRLCLKHNHKFTYHLPQLMGMESLQNIDCEIDAIIVFGSSCSVHDNMTWQCDFNPWLATKIEKNVPILGICYGHQLVAHLEGAEIDYAFSDHKKRKGLFEIELQKSDFTDTSSKQFIFSHNEFIKSLGDNFVTLGHSKECPNEFIKHKTKKIWGVQAHPESSLSFGKTTGMVENINDSQLLDGHNFLDSFIDFITT